MIGRFAIRRNTFLKRRSLSVLPFTLFLFTFLIFSSITACRSLSATEQVDLLNRLLESDRAEVSRAIGQIAQADDKAFIPPLIDFVWADQIGVINNAESAEILHALQGLSGEDIGSDWFDWVSWYAQSNHLPPVG